MKKFLLGLFSLTFILTTFLIPTIETKAMSGFSFGYSDDQAMGDLVCVYNLNGAFIEPTVDEFFINQVNTTINLNAGYYTFVVYSDINTTSFNNCEEANLNGATVTGTDSSLLLENEITSVVYNPIQGTVKTIVTKVGFFTVLPEPYGCQSEEKYIGNDIYCTLIFDDGLLINPLFLTEVPITVQLTDINGNVVRSSFCNLFDSQPPVLIACEVMNTDGLAEGSYTTSLQIGMDTQFYPISEISLVEANQANVFNCSPAVVYPGQTVSCVVDLDPLLSQEELQGLEESMHISIQPENRDTFVFDDYSFQDCKIGAGNDLYCDFTVPTNYGPGLYNAFVGVPYSDYFLTNNFPITILEPQKEQAPKTDSTPKTSVVLVRTGGSNE